MESLLNTPFVQTFIERLLTVLSKAFTTIILLALGYIGAGRADKWLRHYSERIDHLSEHEEEILSRLVQAILIISVLLSIIGVWDINLANLVLGAGIVGAAIGFAARRTLGSAVSGFVLMLSHPFEIGDWVEIGDNEGIVSEITIVNTHLRCVDGELIVIPNDQISSKTIVNRSPRDRIRLRVNVGVDYETDLERAQDIIEEAVETANIPLDSGSVEALPRNFGDSAIEMEVRFWIGSPTPTHRTRAKAEVMRKIKDAFDEEGVDIPFPQRVYSPREPVGSSDTPQPTEPNENVAEQPVDA